MNNKPYVSVVIPTFNHGIYIGRAIESVINQSYQNWELIIVNNSSTDNTMEVIESFKNSKIKVIAIKNQGIIAKSRNMGIKKSQGEWIAFLDSDDWWHPNKLKECLKFSSFDVIYHNLIIKKPNTRNLMSKIKGRTLDQNNSYQDLILNGPGLPNSSILVKKKLLEAIGGVSEDAAKVSWEDFDMAIRLAKIRAKFKYIPRGYGFYWVDGNNMSNPQKTLNNIDSFLSCHGFNGAMQGPWWCNYSIALSLQNLKKRKIDVLKELFLALKKAKKIKDKSLILYKTIKLLTQ